MTPSSWSATAAGPDRNRQAALQVGVRQLGWSESTVRSILAIELTRGDPDIDWWVQLGTMIDRA